MDQTKNTFPKPHKLNIKYIFSLVERAPVRYKFALLPYLPVKTALWLVRYECRFLLHSLFQLCGKACFGVQVLDIMQFMSVGSWADVTCLHYTVLMITSPKKDEYSCPLLRFCFIGSWCLKRSFTKCEPCSLLFVTLHFWLRFLVYPTSAEFFVRAPLHFLFFFSVKIYAS